MTDGHPEDGSTAAPPRLGWRLSAARLALAWERAWPALWPACAAVLAFMVLALFDVLPLLPAWLHALVLLALAATFTIYLWRAVRAFVPPGRGAARRRVELASALEHRPLQALTDDIAAGAEDPQSQALWRLHQQRMAEAARRVRVGTPSPGLARRDPAALRAGLMLLIVVGVAIAGPNADVRLTRALAPRFDVFADGPPPELQLWITPPAYTGLAPLFPKRQTAAAMETEPDTAPAPIVLKAPAGSTLTAQVSGGSGVPALMIDEERVPFTAVDDANSKLTREVARGGRFSVVQNGEVLGAWTIELVPDAPPVVAFSVPPVATQRSALRLAFRASDDYGLDGVVAEMHRTYERGAVVGKEVLELPLALPGLNTRSADEITFHDLTPHHWAGLPVVIRLRAKGGAGHVAYSDEAKLVLPERRFRHPVARAVIEQRKRLTTEPERRDSITEALEGIATRPRAFDHDTVTFLALAAASSRLFHEKEDTAIPPVRDLLWGTALGIEDGRLSVYERDLRRVQDELMRALSENANDAEIERLMCELEQALNRFMRELAQQLRNNPQNQELLPIDPRMRMLESTDLQRMLKQIRDLLRAGERRAAREMLAQLRNMLENLRSGHMFSNDPRARQGNQAMRQLQDLIRRQNELLDRSFRASRGRMGRPQAGQFQSDAEAQRALREALKRFREMLGRMGMNGKDGKGPGQTLGEAGRHMGSAAQALDRAAPGDAVGPQGQALDALQRAGRGMIRQMMNRMARQSGLGMRQRFNPLRQRRDPLGRYLPENGSYDTRDIRIPDEGAVERAQRILRELRRRAGERFRPQLELDYIDRLLQRF